MPIEAQVKLAVLIAFLFVVGSIAAIEFHGAPKFTVKMTGNAESQMFVCGQLKTRELTCLDFETYVAHLKANLEAQKRDQM